MFPRPPKGEKIQSFGIITVFDNEETNCFEYYCTQMRTTFEFSEFVKCGPRNHNLYEYLSAMTPHERDLLRTKSFDELWDDLLLEEKDLFPKTREKVRELFKIYKPHLAKLLDLTKSHSQQPPWLFPKGRRQHNDRTLISAALREMKEEGKLEFGELFLMYDKAINVVHQGTDNCIYITTYYVVRAEERYQPELEKVPENCITQQHLSIDMSNYMWLPLSKNPDEAVDFSSVSHLHGSQLQSAIVELHTELIQ